MQQRLQGRWMHPPDERFLLIVLAVSNSISIPYRQGYRLLQSRLPQCKYRLIVYARVSWSMWQCEIKPAHIKDNEVSYSFWDSNSLRYCVGVLFEHTFGLPLIKRLPISRFDEESSDSTFTIGAHPVACTQTILGRGPCIHPSSFNSSKAYRLD